MSFLICSSASTLAGTGRVNDERTEASGTPSTRQIAATLNEARNAITNAVTSLIGGRAPPQKKLKQLSKYRSLSKAHELLFSTLQPALPSLLANQQPLIGQSISVLLFSPSHTRWKHSPTSSGPTDDTPDFAFHQPLTITNLTACSRNSFV